METFENIIQSYIENRAKDDSLFAETCKKANKSIKGCCKYIYAQAKNMAKGGKVIGIDDDTVFGWAVHYYDEDDIETDEVDDKSVEVSAPSETLSKPANQEKKTKRDKKQKINNMQLSLFSEL